MNDIIVVDDFISKDYANHIEDIVNEKDFPLHFRQGIVTNEDEHEGNVDGFICYMKFKNLYHLGFH